MDKLLDELLGEEEKEETKEEVLVVPDTEKVPQQYRGKPIEVVFGEIEKLVKEREDLVRALETVKSQEKAAETTAPEQSATVSVPGYEAIMDELLTAKVERKLGEDQQLLGYKDEVVAMLRMLPPETRIQDASVASAIAYVKGIHFEELVKKVVPPAVVSDAAAGPPMSRSQVSLEREQLATLAGYYRGRDDEFREFVKSFEEVK